MTSLPQTTPLVTEIDDDLLAEFIVTPAPPDDSVYDATPPEEPDYMRDAPMPPGAATPSATQDGAQTVWPWQPTDAIVYAATPLPTKRELIKGLLPLHGVSIVHALPAHLKTQLVLDMAACIATGSEWLPSLPDRQGGYTFATTQTKVCWLNFDMANEDVHERIAALVRTHGIQPEQFDVVSIPTPWLDLSRLGVVTPLSEWIKSSGYGLVIIDNLANVKGNGKLVDESMIDVMTNTRRIAAESDCHVLLIHHETKHTDGKTASQRMYGGVHVAALIDAGFSVTRKGDYVTVSASKARGYMAVTEFHALHAFTHDANGILDEFRFFAVDKQTMQEADRQEAAPLQHEVLRYMNGAPGRWIPAKEIADALDYTDAAPVASVLARMASGNAPTLERRTLRETDKASKTNPYLYRVAAPVFEYGLTQEST